MRANNVLTRLVLLLWAYPLQVKLLQDVGFDHGFNYKKYSKHEALDEAAPDGIDIYW